MALAFLDDFVFGENSCLSNGIAAVLVSVGSKVEHALTVSIRVKFPAKKHKVSLCLEMQSLDTEILLISSNFTI